ncbi:MAG: enoyl-CoA hydratase/isomerase family protein [Hyphomicrobiales bacterium]|nr:enoyl-CoA hydratase/isomerase family protein [Hyphomicrobiales bacterium]
MSYETITADTSPRGVLTISLNRPERGNAINETMRSEVTGLFRDAAADEVIRIVVLRSNGKHFCAGADVSGPRRPDDAPGSKPPSLGDMLDLIDRFPKPVIAVTQGAAAGAGAALAAVCDVVIALDGAFFSIPEVRMGFAPGGIQACLMRAIGPRQYRRYAISGERIKLDTALRIGLAHEICAPEHADALLAEIIEAYMLGAPNAQGLTKKAVAAAVAGESFDMPHGMASPEAKEGIAAFREKRKPAWYRA